MKHQITTTIPFDNTQWTQDVYTYAENGFLINTVRGSNGNKQATAKNGKKIYRSERHDIKTIETLLTSNVTTVDFHANRWPNSFKIDRDVKTPRIKENYISTQLLEFDDDSKTTSTMDFWHSDNLFQQHGAFIVESSSSTPQTQKCHQILILDKPITDYNLTQEIMKGWYWYYGSDHADFKINSPMRLFYHKENATLFSLGNITTLKDIEKWFLNDYRKFVQNGGENKFDQVARMLPPPKPDTPEYKKLQKRKELDRENLYIASNNFTFPAVMKVDWRNVKSINEQIHRINDTTTDELRAMKINSRNGLYFKYQFPSRSEIVFNLMKWFIRNGYGEDEIYDIFYENNTIIKTPFDVYFQADYMRAWKNIVGDETYIELETLRKNILTNPFIFSIKELQIILAIISMGLRHNTLEPKITMMDFTRMTGITKHKTLKITRDKLIDKNLLSVDIETDPDQYLAISEVDLDDHSHKSRKYKLDVKFVYTTNCEYTNTYDPLDIETQLHQIQALGESYKIIKPLQNNDMSTSELSKIRGVSIRNTNMLIKKLLSQKIVEFYKKGRSRIYQLTDGADDIIHTMTVKQLINTSQIVKQRMDRKEEFNLRKELDIKERRYTGSNPTHKNVNGEWVKIVPNTHNQQHKTDVE